MGNPSRECLIWAAANSKCPIAGRGPKSSGTRQIIDFDAFVGFVGSMMKNLLRSGTLSRELRRA
jgi:hypothetical protein